MKILALEFSSSHRSVAVWADDRICGSAEENDARGTRVLGLIEMALAQACLAREEIECVGVGLGPGSYTGVRAAISLAQGWQLARGVKVLGVSSADCVAAQAHAAGWFGKVQIVADAQRGELYRARYEITASGWSLVEPFVLWPEAQRTPSESRREIILALDAGGPPVPGARILRPEAAMLARLASTRTDFVSGEWLEPVYLREAHFVKTSPARALPFP